MIVKLGAMRILLDTNIIIHRESAIVLREDIGDLFRWLDRIGAEKCVHPESVSEIRRHQDPNVVRSFEVKLRSYHQLRTLAGDTPELTQIRQFDLTPNDSIDTDLIREVIAERVDFLISEDRGIHIKAERLGIVDRVLRIDSFLERVVSDYPALVEYRVLSVKKQYFGTIDITDNFFDSFRRDYPGFNRWFNRKADETAYICQSADGKIKAFLYLKAENSDEPYPDIAPVFQPKRRLKIGSFKVALFGYKLGERFLKIAFDNALALSSDEIYVTAFNRNTDQKCLINLLSDWGFVSYGTKRSVAGEEEVWVKSFTHRASLSNPSNTYPFMSLSARKYIVPIRPEYHTELLPDSILRTESPFDYVENRPNRNAIRKVYISRSHFRDLQSGDIIVFYRTKSGEAPAHYTSVATTLGIVETVRDGFTSFHSFRRACRGVTVFTEGELRRQWEQIPSIRPFIVQFLYSYSLPRRPNLAIMKQETIIIEAPRGFEVLTDDGFNRLLEIADARDCPIVD